MHLVYIAVASSIIITTSASPRPQTLPPTSDVKPQACLSAAQAIPTCGRQCLEQAATSVGCGVVDFTCSCPKQSAVASAATSCVLNACSGISAAEAVQSAAQAVCSCVNQQPAGDSSSSSSSSSSVAASVPAPTMSDSQPATSPTPAAAPAAPVQQQQPAQPQNVVPAANSTTENPPTQNSTTQNPPTQDPPTQNPPTQNPPTENPPTQNPPTGQQQQQQRPPTQQQPPSGSSSQGSGRVKSASGGGSLESLFGGGLSSILSDFLV